MSNQRVICLSAIPLSSVDAYRLAILIEGKKRQIRIYSNHKSFNPRNCCTGYLWRWANCLGLQRRQESKALGERAVTEMRLREALEDQLAEEQKRRIQLENELIEFKEDH